MKSSKRIVIIAVSVIAIIAGVSIWVMTHPGNKDEKRSTSITETRPEPTAHSDQIVLPADSPKLEQLRIESVEMASLPIDEVTVPGKIEANPNKVSRVALPVAGRVATVMVKLGDRVSAGQPLLTIDSQDADAAMSALLQAEAGISQANAGIAKAAADLAKAQADYDRADDLYQHNAIAQKDLLNAENILKENRATLDAAKATLDQARAMKQQAWRRLEQLGLEGEKFGQKVTVRAPIAGKILEMSVAPGEFRNDTNTPLMTIADLSSVMVSSDMPENSIRLVQVGDHLEVHLNAYPNETFSGRVNRIMDMVDPQTRTIKVQAELENTGGRFRPEMFGTIRLTKEARSVPVLPKGAVIQGDNRDIVYVERAKGQFQPVAVKVGKPSGDLLPVLNGVNAGDRVVVEGAMLLKGLQ